MAGRILSIEIENSLTYVIETDQGVKTPKIYQFFSFPTPPDVMTDDGVEISEAFITQMKRRLEEHKIHTTKAIFTITSTRIANRDVTIPLVKENRIQSLLMANSKEYFPVDVSEYQIVYRVLEKINTKEKKNLLLSVFAVPNSLIESYYLLAKACGLQVSGLDYTGNSIFQTMVRVKPEGMAASIRVESGSSMITIIRNGRILLQRGIGYGLDEAIETIKNSGIFDEHISSEEVIKLMRQRCLIQSGLRTKEIVEPDNLKENSLKALRGEVTQSLVMLIGNVSRVIRYFTANNPDILIEKITLVGLGADCEGLSELFTTELGISVVKLQGEPVQKLAPSVEESSFHVAEYIACIGATFHPLNFALSEEEQVNRKIPARRDSMVAAYTVFGICLVASVGMLVTSAVSNALLSRENHNLQGRINEQRPVVDIYNEYIQTKALYDGMLSLDTLSNTANDSFLDFISEMEAKMPSDLLVSTMTASSEGISLSVTTTSKESAADVIAQLRTFTSVYGIQCSGITEQVGESGDTIESFDITVTYANMPLTTEEGSQIDDETQTEDESQND